MVRHTENSQDGNFNICAWIKSFGISSYFFIVFSILGFFVIKYHGIFWPYAIFDGQFLLGIIMWPTIVRRISEFIWQIIGCFLLYMFEMYYGTVNFFIKVLFDMAIFEIIHFSLGVILVFGYRHFAYYLVLTGIWPIWLSNLSAWCFKKPLKKVQIFSLQITVPRFVFPLLVFTISIFMSWNIVIQGLTALLIGLIESKLPLFKRYLALSSYKTRKIEQCLMCFNSFCTIYKPDGVPVVRERTIEQEERDANDDQHEPNNNREEEYLAREKRRKEFNKRFEEVNMRADEETGENMNDDTQEIDNTEQDFSFVN